MAILASALGVGILGGCISVLVDFDHVIAYKRKLDHRFLHPYYLWIACIVIFCCLTLLGGFICQLVLK